MIGVFTGLVQTEEKSSWTCVVWPESVETLKTGKPVKVLARIGNLDFEVTLMPVGGRHMVPLRKEVLRELHLRLGDLVTVEIVGVKAKASASSVSPSEP